MRRWLIACVICAVLCGSAVAQPAPRAAERAPFDLSVVDQDPDSPFLGFYAIRVNELAGLPLIGDMVRLCGSAFTNPVFGINIAFDLKAEEIEQIVGMVHLKITPATPDAKGTMMLGADVRLIRLTRDIDWKQQIEKNFRKVKEHEYKGRAYYECDLPPPLAALMGKLAKDQSFYFYPADARTLHMASVAAIQRRIDAGSPHSEPQLAGLRALHDSTLLLVVPDVNGRLLKELGPVFDCKDEVPEEVGRKIKAVLQGVRSVQLAVDTRDELTLRAEAKCRNTAEAKELQATAQLLREPAREMLRLCKPAKAMEKKASDGVGYDILDRVLQALEVEVSAENFVLRTRAKVPFLTDLRRYAQDYPLEVLQQSLCPVQPPVPAPTPGVLGSSPRGY